MKPKSPKCDINQYSDMEMCMACGLKWDVGDYLDVDCPMVRPKTADYQHSLSQRNFARAALALSVAVNIAAILAMASK